MRYGKAGFEIHGQPEGRAMNVDFALGGTKMVALNGGPHFRPTPAVSYFVTLEEAAAVDRVWEGLLEAGRVLMPLDAYEWSPHYGWLEDRWGVSWQVAQGALADVGGQTAGRHDGAPDVDGGSGNQARAGGGEPMIRVFGSDLFCWLIVAIALVALLVVTWWPV
jgi:predicted 3-demethylubiquinone-9 3-methyltransferase (glyoxalase superfamily)